MIGVIERAYGTEKEDQVIKLMKRLSSHSFYVSWQDTTSYGKRKLGFYRN